MSAYNGWPEVDDEAITSNISMRALKISLFEKYLDSIELWTGKSNRVKMLHDYARKYINDILGVDYILNIDKVDFNKYKKEQKGTHDE